MLHFFCQLFTYINLTHVLQEGWPLTALSDSMIRDCCSLSYNSTPGQFITSTAWSSKSPISSTLLPALHEARRLPAAHPWDHISISLYFYNRLAYRRLQIHNFPNLLCPHLCLLSYQYVDHSHDKIISHCRFQFILLLLNCQPSLHVLLLHQENFSNVILSDVSVIFLMIGLFTYFYFLPMTFRTRYLIWCLPYMCYRFMNWSRHGAKVYNLHYAAVVSV